MPHRATRLVAVLLILLGFATAPSTAQAKRVACWRSVLLDWADNDRLDKRYERSCYRRALRHLRTDLAIYSNARDEIERALVLAGLPSGPPHDPALEAAAAPAALSPAVRTQPVLSERLELL